MSNSTNYKMWHTPNKNHFNESGNLKKGETHQGYYNNLQNPQKYVGDPKLIIYRSGWELSFIRWCDASPSVIRWSSEPTTIPYYDRVSKLDECKRLGLDPNNPRNWIVRNYHVDFWIELDKGDNVTQKMFIEIKPSGQLTKPRPPVSTASLKEQRKFNNAAKTYLINEAKFCAMNAWAEKNNSKFYVFTEKTLSALIGPFF